MPRRSLTVGRNARRAQVLQQVDAEGCSRAAAVLKGLPVESVLLVAQTQSFATQELDLVDVVVKKGGCSSIQAAA
jgi:hypothetical protein